MDQDRKKEISQKIGKKIYALRKEHNLSREKFAELCNISAQHVYYMEKGEFLPGCITLIDICNQFHISPSELLLDTLPKDSYILEENISNSFNQLSNEEKSFIIQMVNTMIDLFLKNK